jgi:hypothetical protein
MMILWGATTDEEDERTLSWFASGEPGIKDGTQEMLLAMMKDLGYQVSKVESWEVRPVRTNYVEGKWKNAWEITAKLPARVAELPLQGRSVESKATDATFDGTLPSGEIEHVMFVDFADSDIAERAERILGVVGKELDMTLSHRGSETATLLASFGVVTTIDDAKTEKASAVFAQLGARVELTRAHGDRTASPGAKTRRGS